MQKSKFSLLGIRQISWLVFFFSIAMGFMETAVVVYLREIYYPEGFNFPLQPMEGRVLITEIFREAATIIMLVAIGWLSGRTATERFAFFIFSFAVWDICYYLFLYVILGWPSSLLTWDVLFLIPTTWTGPVAGPVLNSLLMIVLALAIIHYTGKNANTKISRNEWIILIAGALLTILSYLLDYLLYMLKDFSLSQIWSWNTNTALQEYAFAYIPQKFNWWLFVLSQLVILAGIGMFVWRCRKNC